MPRFGWVENMWRGVVQDRNGRCSKKGRLWCLGECNWIHNQHRKERETGWCTDVGSQAPPCGWLKKARLRVRTYPCRQARNELPLAHITPGHPEGFRLRMHINDINDNTARRSKCCAWYSWKTSPLQMQADRLGKLQPANMLFPSTRGSQAALPRFLFLFLPTPPSLLAHPGGSGVLDRLQSRGWSRAQHPDKIVNRDHFIVDAETGNMTR